MTVDWGGLELQLRELPDVVAAGFTVTDEKVVVHLLLGPSADEAALRGIISELTASVIDQPVTIETATGQAVTGGPDRPPVGSAVRSAVESEETRRVRLVGVWIEAISGTVEVQIAHGDHPAVGRSQDVGATAGAEATLAALAQLGADVSFRPEAETISVSEQPGIAVVVVLHRQDGAPRYGIASAEIEEVAAVRATLHALNRYLEAHLPSISSAGPRPG